MSPYRVYADKWWWLAISTYWVFFVFFFAYFAEPLKVCDGKLSGLLPPDGLRYCESVLFGGEVDLIDIVRETGIVVLNWNSIVLLGRLMHGWFGEGFVLAVGVANLLLISFAAANFFRIGYLAKLQKWKLGMLFAFAQPYLFLYTPVLNKETFMLFIVSHLGLNFLRHRSGIFPTLLIGLLKVQVVLVWCVGKYAHNWRRLLLLLVVASLIVPVAKGQFSLFNIASFIENQGSEIRSAQLVVGLAEVERYPLVFVVTAPIRVMLNLGAGFAFWRFLEIDGLGVLCFVVTTFMLSVTVLALGVKACFTRARLTAVQDSLMRFSASYCLVFSLIPFLQARYYWVLMPILWIVFLSKNRIELKWD